MGGRGKGHLLLGYGIMWKTLENAQRLICINQGYAVGLKLIKAVLNEIRPFHIEHMLQLCEHNKETERMLLNQDVVLFLGHTGAGKYIVCICGIADRLLCPICRQEHQHSFFVRL